MFIYLSNYRQFICLFGSLDYLPEDLGHENKFTSELVIIQDKICI